MAGQGKTSQEHVFLLYALEAVTILHKDPVGCRMCQLLKIPPAAADSLPCFQGLHFTGCEDFSPSELSASSHATLPLTPLCLTPLPSLPAGSALSPTVLCRGATPGHSCLFEVFPVAMSSLHPRSPAQLSSRGPAQGGSFSAHSGLPCGVSGSPEILL